MKIKPISSISFAALLAGLSTTSQAHSLLHHTTVEIDVPNPIEHLTDGTSDTAYITQNGFAKGDSVVLTLAEPLKSDQIIAVPSGRLPGDPAQLRTEDFFDGAVLEYSSDSGKTWQHAGGIKCELITGTIPAGATHLRLLATEDVNHRVAINDPEVFDFDPILAETRSIEIDGETVELSIYAQLDPEGATRAQMESMIEMYFDLWPQMVELIGTEVEKTRRHLDLIPFPGLKFPGFNFRSRIVVKTEHLIERPNDIYGLFAHELTHLVQNYGEGKAPLWIVEGIADYARYKLTDDENWEAGFLKKITRREPLGAYADSAGFFLYLEDRYKKPIARPVSMALSSGNYGADTWKQLTGRSLEQLCVDYAKDDTWVPAPKQ